MVIKSWKFTGFKSTFPDWVQDNTSKRAGSKKLWVHTQYGEAPARVGEWISINLRGHVDIHSDKPREGWSKKMMAGSAFAIIVLVLLVTAVSLW